MYRLLYRCTFSIFVLHFKSTINIFKLLNFVDVAIFNLQFDLGFFVFRKTNHFLFLQLMISHFILLFFCDLFDTVSYGHLILLIFRPHKINSSIVSSGFTFIIRLIRRPGFYVQRTSANLTIQLKSSRPGEKDIPLFSATLQVSVIL